MDSSLRAIAPHIDCASAQAVVPVVDHLHVLRASRALLIQNNETCLLSTGKHERTKLPMLLFKLCNKTLQVCLCQCQALSEQTILAILAGALLVRIAMQLQSVAACCVTLHQLSEKCCLKNAKEDRLRISRLVQSDGQLTLTA